MDKRSKIIIGIFIVVLISIIVTELIRPKAVNWKESYTAEDTIPFGCYVLYNELETLFNDEKVQRVDESLYTVISNDSSAKKSCYIMVNNGLDFDEQEYNQLLNYVSEGNEVFIASSYFGSYLSDTLNIQIRSAYNIKEDTTQLSFTNQKFEVQKFDFKKGIYNRHFASVDSINTTILGYINFTTNEFISLGDSGSEVSKKAKVKPNFIKVAFGTGNFYLNSTPIAFTNYYLLNGNQDYVSQSLSYLKQADIVYWDNYKKSGRVVINSPLRFILNQEALKWSYYLTLCGIIIFLLFKAKREQRIIPVIEPLENSSIEFARAVGSLYHQHRDYNDLIVKKTNYFLEYLRSTFHINTSVLNEQTIHQLAGKSGKSLSETKEIIEFIIQLKNSNANSERQLIELDKKINTFKI